MSIRGKLLAAIIVVVFASTVTGGAAAQAERRTEVRGEVPPDWRLQQRGQRPHGPALDLLRRVAPAGDIQDWVLEGELGQLRSDNNLTKSARAELLLEIDADGRIAKCKVKEATSGSGAEALCERLASRVRMIPALDRTGARTADFYDVTVWRHGEVSLLPPRLQVRPARVAHWPYQDVSLTVVRGGFDHLTAHPFSGGAYNGPVALVEVVPDDRGGLRCILISGYIESPALNGQACPAALQGQFDFTGQNRGKSAYFFFFEQEGRMAVLLPAYDRMQIGGPRPDSMAEVREGLTRETVSNVRMNFFVDVNGEISSCTIHTSSGDDLQDYAACDRLQRLGRFDRSLDVFGRAVLRDELAWGLPAS